ncbi:MAG: prolyl oligopeptidase family serine peptidase, partial [Thermoguttaceae bacterium]|nr:prolyl oligopeptidase family serine peptidase [Thermoguttaceae bacterium]
MKIWKPTASAAFGAALFLGVFAASAFINTVSAADLTGSGALRSEEESAGDFGREIISIAYINREGKVESRPIVLYRPANASGDLPLVYVPHYPIDESAPVLKEYMARGWAAASPTEFKPEYNGQLADDNLVFNNAALYALRRRDGIDGQRIAVVGGSAGGYTALMLCELQMGVCAAVAHSPVANLYYNFAVYFRKCDELNAAAGEGGLPVPVQGMISSTFRPINDGFDGPDDPRWEALSPVALIQC